MKQFDTVENNEWIPTEEDLEGAIKVVDTLPTASASELGTTYLLNGVMDGYTKTHFYKCVKQTVDGVETYSWEDLQVGRYSVGNCTNIRLMMFDDGDTYRVIISWNDPEDVTVGSDHVYWKETRLVHQVGHCPVDVNDGIETFINTYRNQYSSFGSFTFTFAADGRKHYFKLFPVSEDGAITNDDANSRVAGYNYVQTADNTPAYDYDAGQPIKTYYQKTYNSSTGLYEFTAMDWNATYFGGSGTSESPYTFISSKVYYEYQNAFINWTGIRDLIKNGEAANYFPVGTILTLPYHGDFGEMAYEVVDFDRVQPADPSIGHTMTLESKYLNTWWDYNGGVVFDTNELPGCLTGDTARDFNKTYFVRLTNGGSKIYGQISDKLCFMDATENTVANSNYAVSGQYELYVESVFDSHRHYNQRPWTTSYLVWFDQNKFGLSNTYHPSGSSWTAGTMYECELPYVTNRLVANDVRQSISAVDGRMMIDSSKGNATSAGNVNGYGNTAALVASNAGTHFIWNTSSNTNVSVNVWNTSSNSAVAVVHKFAQGAAYALWEDENGQYRWRLRQTQNNATNAPIALNYCVSTLADCEVNLGVHARWLAPTNTAAKINAWQISTGATVEETREMRQNYTYRLEQEGDFYRWKCINSADVRGSSGSVYKWGVPPSDLKEEYTVEASVSGQTDDSGIARTTGDKIVGTTIPQMAHGGFTVSAPDTANTVVTDGAASFATSETATSAKAWGPLVYPQEPRGNPRSNYYADMFMPVPRIGTSSSSTGRAWERNAKYFIPVEQYVSKYRSTCAIGSKTAYATARSKYMRNCVRDIERAYAGISTSGSELAAYMPFLYASGGSGSTTTYSIDFGKVLENLIRFPTHDDVFMSGKKYWKLHVCPTVSNLGDKDLQWTWFYKKVGKNCDGSDRWERSLRDAALAAGADGGVGIMVPVTVGTPGSGWTADGTVLDLYWKEVATTETAFWNVPYFATKSISTADSNLYTGSLATRTSTLYTPCYFKTAQTIIPNTGKIPYAVINDGVVKFTDDGTTFYGEDDTDFRGMSPVKCNTHTYVSGSTTITMGYPGFASLNVIGTNANHYGIKTTDYYEAAISYYDAGAGVLGWDGTTVIPLNGSATATAGTQMQVNVFFKTANMERVAYGNHVWAQSNIRYYFNGPFDKTAEYLPTRDQAFYSTGLYFKLSGSTYTRLVAGSENTATTYVNGTTIAAWKALNNNIEVYTKYPGGIPVGYKLDINRPDKYHDYGISPVMQYDYDVTLLRWRPKYAAGSAWWSEEFYTNGEGHKKNEPIGIPSINNGCVYDRLAPMFWSNCILQGDDGVVDTIIMSPKQDATVSGTTGAVTFGGWTGDNMKVKIRGQFQTMTGCDLQSGTATRTATFKQVYPRQSFLHGFLDCKYHRTQDQVAQEGKDYYLKSPYGSYEKLDANDSFVTGGPYAHGLYEYNNNYYNDLSDAKEFLEAIVPVVNRNGCYGTTGAYDLYPHGGVGMPNLGGTVTVDKVWLMSTGQVNGGNGANNGITENPQLATATTTGSLTKWGGYSGQPLNDARVKKGLTLGAHGTSGYADAMAGAQYWWLRSAGGDVYYKNVYEEMSTYVRNIGEAGNYTIWINGGLNANNSETSSQNGRRLSPLITLG